jgi:hypothetical protein
MKTLDLNAYGVTEINEHVLESVDGGLWWITSFAEWCTNGISLPSVTMPNCKIDNYVA